MAVISGIAGRRSQALLHAGQDKTARASAGRAASSVKTANVVSSRASAASSLISSMADAASDRANIYNNTATKQVQARRSAGSLNRLV